MRQSVKKFLVGGWMVPFMRLIVACAFCLISCMLIAQEVKLSSAEDASRGIVSYIQNVMRFNQTLPQEKVYLHLDNTGYFEGETVWFKAYVTRADNGHPTTLSKVLYVELLNPSGDVVKESKLYIDELGQAHGDLKLDTLYGTGFYEIRAYTRYMTNWGVNACFSRVFPVFKAPKEEGDYSDLTISTKLYSDRDPNNRDQSDPLYAKAVQEGIYTNERAKTISVHFYPEGGDLMQGKRSRVAMMAVNDNGRPYQGEGFLLDESGVVLATVSTDTLGRGLFEVKPDGGKLVMKMHNMAGKEQEFALPQARENGCVLTLNVVDEDMLASIQCTDSVCGHLLGYALMHNGNIFYCDTMMASPLIEIELNRQKMKEGVNQMTVFDTQGRILADRLFFICPKTDVIDSIKFVTATPRLKPCGRVVLDVQTLPNAVFSFSAIDAGSLNNGRQGNLKTWMLLGSEVRGYIPHVEHYFEADDQTHRIDADMLMLTQGWRRYNWSVMSGASEMDLKQPFEDKFYMFGKLNRYRKRNDVANVQLKAFLYNQAGQSLSGQTTTDENGHYAFELPFLNGEWNMQIFTTIDDKRKTFLVGVDRQFSPPPRYITPLEAQVMLPKQPNIFVHKPDEVLPEEDVFVPITEKNILLQDVTVKAKKKQRYFTNDNFKFKNEDYGRKWASTYYNVDRELDNILDRGEDEPTIFEFLAKRNTLFNNPDCIDLPSPVAEADSQWTEWTGRMSYGHHSIEWIVDNGDTHIKGAFTDAGHAAGDPFFPFWMHEVKSIYIAAFDPDRDAQSVYDAQMGSDFDSYASASDVAGAAKSNSVKIYLYLHHKFSTESNKGLRKTYFQGFNEPSTFKMEDYSVVPPMADFRRTIYWNPNIKTDAEGKARVEFFNNSVCEEMYISAEGITTDGRIILKE